MAAQIAGEDRICTRECAFQGLSGRSGPHESEPDIRHLVYHRQQIVQILFVRQPADIDRQRHVGMAVGQSAAHPLGTRARMVRHGVDGLGPQVDVGDPAGDRCSHHLGRCAQVHLRTVVQGGCPAVGGTGQPGQVQILGVAGQLGVIRGEQGDVAAFGGQHTVGRQPGRVDRVHDLGPEGDHLLGYLRGRQPDLDLRIPRPEADRTHLDDVETCIDRGWGTGREDQHVMAHRRQLVQGAQHPGDHTVDLGQEDLGEHRDAHRRGRSYSADAREAGTPACWCLVHSEVAGMRLRSARSA